MKLVIALALLAACSTPARNSPGDDDDGSGGADGGTGMGTDGGGSGLSGSAGTTYVYAHTASTLYRVDPDSLSLTEVADFGWPLGTDQMTDIAIDKTGRMIGVSFSNVYQVDPTTAQATLLSLGISGSYNGLSFVPASLLGQTGDDVLVGTDNSDGNVYQINPSSGSATVIGDMGGSFVSSGDLVAVDNFGIIQTVPGDNGDAIVRLGSESSAGTFAATQIGTGTGFTDIWGVAFWKGTVFGFTDGGQFVTIDPSTGSATLVTSTSVEWYGAAVTTVAPVIQ